MKIMKVVSVAGAKLALTLGVLFGSNFRSPAQTEVRNALSMVVKAQMLAADEAVEKKIIPTVNMTISPVHPAGTYWSLQLKNYPPLPGSPFPDLPVYVLDAAHRLFLLDDRSVDYPALWAHQAEQAADEAVLAELESGGAKIMAMSRASNSSYSDNPVYLTNLVVTLSGNPGPTASFSIGGGTNFVPYDILMTTNIANNISQWTWFGIGYTPYRYMFSNQPPAQAFYTLAQPQKTMIVAWGDDFFDQCKVPSGISNAVAIAGGYGHSLVLLKNGMVVSWGDTYQAPTNLAGVAMIAAGWNHDVALLTNGTIAAWGDNLFGETSVPSGLTNMTVISAQALNTLALRDDGTVVAWGDNFRGQSNVPGSLSNVAAIAAGGEHSLAVSNGFVVAWGYNAQGQCNVPGGLNDVLDVAAGWAHSIALKKDGTVVCWGDNSHGETTVPLGLSNVVAIAAGGGEPFDDSAYTVALKCDGTLIVWGDSQTIYPVDGLTNIIAIAAGADHALTVRTGPATPVITLEPTDQYQIAGGSVTFTARGAGLYGVTYQWQTNGVNLAGATNASLMLTNVQAVQQQNAYTAKVSNEAGNIVSSNTHVYLLTPPVITSQNLLTNVFVLYQSNLTLNVVASAPGQFNGFPLGYQWQLNGTNISGPNSSSYTFSAGTSGTYSVVVSNLSGSTTAMWQVLVVYPGSIIGWGANTNSQLSNSPQLTNVISLAAGKAHGIVATESGSVTNWGSYWTGTNFISVVEPPLVTNAIAVAAGSRHDIALKTDGTVIAWGLNYFGQTNTPSNATNGMSISAGGQQSLLLKRDGTVVQWGQTNAPIPAGLTNVMAIASGTDFHLALLKNSTVIAWGVNDYGQTNIPANLSNVVAVAAGGVHALALKADGTVTAWGALTNVPAGLSNVLNVAAGENHNIALKNDGMVVAWGDNTFGQTNGVIGFNRVKLIAGGGDFTLAVQFSPLVQYLVDVTKDLLLVYNTNSVDGIWVKDYYLAHRPLVSSANVLAIGCTNIPSMRPEDYTNTIAAPVQKWLADNPTKRPQYVILMAGIPWRVNTNPSPVAVYHGPYGIHESVQFQLSAWTAPGWQPFITSINMGEIATDTNHVDYANYTNACKAYIDKLEAIGTNYSPGKLIISASAGGYGNTNYVIDDVKNIYCGNSAVSNAQTGLIAAGISPANISYLNGCEVTGNLAHLTNGNNVAAYISWGSHSSLENEYAHYIVKWQGASSWWIIETIESFNGQPGAGQGDFWMWFASWAFGGTNYSNTPIGAVTHVDEPGLGGVNRSSPYFGLWASGKTFGICAWNSRNTQYFLAVGDPFVKR